MFTLMFVHLSTTAQREGALAATLHCEQVYAIQTRSIYAKHFSSCSFCVVKICNSFSFFTSK